MRLALEKLAGSWGLVDWVEVMGGQIVDHPFGKGAKGRLFYDASSSTNGTMAAFLSHENWATAAADTPATLDIFLSYAGTFEAAGSVVHHMIDQSSLPFLAGTTLTREVLDLSDDTLVLKADIPGRDDADWHLIWQRA